MELRSIGTQPLELHENTHQFIIPQIIWYSQTILELITVIYTVYIPMWRYSAWISTKEADARIPVGKYRLEQAVSHTYNAKIIEYVKGPDVLDGLCVGRLASS